MADTHNIIIKKVKKSGGDGHHGGAWKVAYADFVTAMMAFFLLMWLLGATTEDQRTGIADYFNPTIPLSQVSGGGKDLLNGSSVFAEETYSRMGSGGDRTPPDQQPLNQDTRGALDVETPGEGQGSGAADDGGDALNALQEDILQKALQDESEGLLSHIQTRITDEGLVIELVEVDGSPLFELGSTRPSRTMEQLLNVVASTISLVNNKVAIVGHTDSRGFRNRVDYTNWELSSDRANVARRLMVKSGLESTQISAVSGKADSEPLTADPLAPQNRRISITLLRD
ncbi:MAG: flagellar motor protein MotB [Pseudomonadota bacterium]